MRWRGLRGSSNVEDRRGIGVHHLAIGGGIGGLIIYLIYNLLSGDTSGIQPVVQAQTQQETTAEDTLADFISVVLANTEDVWNALFMSMGKNYSDPKLVLYTETEQSGCGFASNATGPFYCPEDEKVYLDLSFFKELRYRFKSPGDFAIAYVVAHEVGHHVQKLLGILEEVNRRRGRMSEADANKLSVKLELQADFLAGVWANHAQKMDSILDPGDIEEALRAASAIGDDRLQMQQQGYLVPDAFTHGTSEQRIYWFKKGFHTGDIRQGNTFNDPFALQENEIIIRDGLWRYTKLTKEKLLPAVISTH
jgi:uncharacterized protein